MKAKRPRQTFMTVTELVAAGESLYGSRWRTPLAKELKLSDRIIRYYETGERRIPEHTAARIRQLADIGRVGFIIRGSVRKAAPDLPPFRCHKIAVQVLADLSAGGLLASDE